MCTSKIQLVRSFSLSAACTVDVEPVGRWFEVYCRRRQHKHTLSEASIESSSSEGEDEDLSDGEEDDTLLQTLDPKDWKVKIIVVLVIKFQEYSITGDNAYIFRTRITMLFLDLENSDTRQQLIKSKGLVSKISLKQSIPACGR